MIYNIVIYFVLWGIAIASLFNEKVRKMWRGEREAFKILKQKVDPNAKYIWFHAASLGEFEQGRPLMERIRKDYPQYKILLTFYSRRPRHSPSVCVAWFSPPFRFVPAWPEVNAPPHGWAFPSGAVLPLPARQPLFRL